MQTFFVSLSLSSLSPLSPLSSLSLSSFESGPLFSSAPTHPRRRQNPRRDLSNKLKLNTFMRIFASFFFCGHVAILFAVLVLKPLPKLRIWDQNFVKLDNNNNDDIHPPSAQTAMILGGEERKLKSSREREREIFIFE